MITKEEVGSFNPFEMKAMYCPCCGSKGFVELWPYGGLWCKRCNAEFEVWQICDGPDRVGVGCKIDDIWSDLEELVLEWANLPRDGFHTTIWKGDSEIVWRKRELVK